jgi:Kef-type K+ transport system membrane component KefB
MFFLGLEVDIKHMQKSLRQSIPIAVCSIVVPFACGAGLSLWFYDLEPTQSSFTTFLLFLGTALSFTAFPVLARVLTSAQLLTSPVGGQALSCAAVDDLLAWATLALTLSYSSGGGLLNGLYVALISIGLIMFLVVVVRPGLDWYHKSLIARGDELNRNFLALLFLLLCLTAWFSQVRRRIAQQQQHQQERHSRARKRDHRKHGSKSACSSVDNSIGTFSCCTDPGH